MSLKSIFKHKPNKSEQKFPVFWLIGPTGCGKSTLAEMLANCSKFHLINAQLLMKDDLLKWNKTAKIIRTSQSAIGYIIDGYPTKLNEAKLFEERICSVSVVICLTLVLDGLLARKVTQIGAYDVNEARIQYVNETSNMTKISKRYNHKIIKLHANYPPESTCTKLIEILEDFWGYKFLRLYNKHLNE
ncbi:hypothetical protein FQR65_LT08184 [Abscondita terminalis]|nr:hypothetical protein FQR65_LT08184 [Abscondita terminalis]